MKFFTRCALAAAAILVPVSFALAAEAQPAAASRPASAPASLPSAVPQEVLDKMDAMARPPETPLPADQAAAHLEKALQNILQAGAAAEREYASAGNLHLVRIRMLQATDMLRRITGKQEYDKETLDVAHRILASECPAEFKAQADWFVTRAKMREDKLKGTEAADEIRRYAARYTDGNAAANALCFALILARQSELGDLVNELADKLQSAHGNNVEVKGLLRRIGRHPDVGRPFETELTTLAGKKLTLPKDLTGKVVVIDFWATWCQPCVREMPHMKQVYEKYAGKGVEIVGISLDRDKDALVKFVQENKIPWTQTFDGPTFPAAEKYGIDSIPSIWVIGKDGKVISDDAREELEKTLDAALSAAASKPAGKAK